MDDIIESIKEKKYDIISFILLIIAILFLFYNGYYRPYIKYNTIIQNLSNEYHNNILAYTKQISRLNKKTKKDDNNTTLDTVPELLQRINDTCKAPKVIIRTLVPKKDNPFAFELKFIASYFNFLVVLSEFEKLNININKIDIKPYEINDNNSKHIITLDIEAINGGKKLSTVDINFLNKELSKTKKRDPFQRFAKTGSRIKRLVDLTWIYQLSGIGKIDGNYVATINRRVYYINSKFNGMQIVDISPRGVKLQKNTDNGVVNYILNFRKKEQKKGDNNALKSFSL